MDRAMTNKMQHELDSKRWAGLSRTSEEVLANGVWIPDAAIIEAERRRKEEIDRRERPFLEVPRHPVLEEAPPEPVEPGGTVIILDI